MSLKKKNIAILGSTGSIGTQTLEVIEAFPDLFQAEVLTAQNNAELLIRQAIQFLPNVVVIVNEDHYQKVRDGLKDTDIKVYTGEEALLDVGKMHTVDIVLTALVGYSGLLPTIEAIKSSKTIALANKETLVVAGELITKLTKEYHADILPVDSEHSAIFQCLVGEHENSVEKIILTASGGPFRGKTTSELSQVSKKDALNHPNWEMGAKITIDSATLMNKGLEVIEAKWLFGLDHQQIDVIVHPQSIIHSLVQFNDGSLKAQLGLPDMKLPIQYALGFPKRLQNDFERFNFVDYPSLTFEKPDTHTFKALALAFDAMKIGGNSACTLNAANEVAVAAFLEEKISFLQIADTIEETLNKAIFFDKPDLETYIESDNTARQIANKIIKEL